MQLRTDRYKLKEAFPQMAGKFAQKLHKKADDLEFVRKMIPIDPAEIEVKDGERAAIRLITTPHLDRDEEILVPSGAMLDEFRQSPSVFYGHEMRDRLPIGSDLWIKHVPEGILAKTQYANHQFAEDVWQCVKQGHLLSNSVGFIPIEWVTRDDKKGFALCQDTLEKDYGIDKDESGRARVIYTKWLMLEHSDVGVASNAQSLNIAVSKGLIEIESERLREDLEIDIDFDTEAKDEDALDIEEKAEEDVELDEPVTVPVVKLEDLQADDATLDDLEAKAYDVPDEKVLSLKGQPSVNDLYEAIYRATGYPFNEVGLANPDYLGWPLDLYPSKYPSAGQVVVVKGSEAAEPFIYDYKIEDGEAVLSKPVAVDIGYRERWAGDIEEKLCAEADKNTTYVTPTGDIDIEVKDPNPDVDVEAPVAQKDNAPTPNEDEIDLTPEQITKALKQVIAEGFAQVDIKAVIAQSIDKALDRERGKIDIEV